MSSDELAEFDGRRENLAEEAKVALDEVIHKRGINTKEIRKEILADSTAKENKSSRWWILFHLWGGIWLKEYVDVSGLSKLLLGGLSGSDPASASTYAGTAGLIAAGAVAIGYFLSRFLVKAIDGSAMPKKAKLIIKTILPIVYVAGAVSLAMATAPLIAPSTGVSKKALPAAQSSDIEPVMAFTTIQSAGRLREVDLDQTVLKNLETWLVKTIHQGIWDKAVEMGYNPKDPQPNVVANSAYVTTGGKKLAVIKITMDYSVRSVTILGIKGNELHRVNCIRVSNHDIPVWSGECGNKVHEVFGVTIQP